MHYVQGFIVNGVETKQVACIELNGKPNAATEGKVGLLAIDISSPSHEVYVCVAVKGAIYTWEMVTGAIPDMSNYYTKTEIDNLVGVNLAEIDNLLGGG